MSREFKPGEDLALRYSQVGLPFLSDHSIYLTVYLKSPAALSFSQFKKIAADLYELSRKCEFEWVATIGISLQLWSLWFLKDRDAALDELFADEQALRTVLGRRPPYALTGGDLFFQVQSLEKEKVREINDEILARLEPFTDHSTFTIGDSLHEGRIYGGRLLHGLIGSVDPVCFSARAIIGDELPRHKGGCFCLTQKFIHDWEQLSGMADDDLENLIGRDHGGNIILSDDDRCHIKLARVSDENGLNYRLVGQSQPFRSPASEKALGPGREEGVYQISYAKSLEAFAKVLHSLVGDREDHIKSRHFQVSHATEGNYWYVPGAPELDLPAPHAFLTVLMNKFFDIRSKNGSMFYNTKSYLQNIGNRTVELDPPVTDRVIELLGYTFSRWHDTWYRRRPIPELGHLESYMEKDRLARVSVAERKGLAVKKTLELLSSRQSGQEFDTFRIHPREIIVGVVPDFTLGSGQEAMGYLNANERDEAFLLRLNEAGAAGHNVPNYRRLLELGVGGLLEDVKRRRAEAGEAQAQSFFQSVIYALEGVQIYMRNYSALAGKILASMKFGSPQDRKNLQAIAERMERLSIDPPKTFVDAAQLVFSMHCAMHIAGDSTSIGRLDQLLAPFYDTASISPAEAQEVIDCFWIKMDEKVLLNHRHFADRLSRGSGAITYQGGDFPQGAALNQWVQQVTVGGWKAEDGEAQDAVNDVTRMCLRAARRLPLNAPCLSLRVHAGTSREILEEAADCLLSGGAHPLLINDEKVVAGLLRSGVVTSGGGSIVSLADARDMVCDGCFEPLMAGKSEFAFCYVPVPEAIEMALNRGRTYALAGPDHLMGLKASFRSKRPDEIGTWDEFYDLFLKHYRFKLLDFYDGMLGRYGNLSKVCPSPLLSALIDGCLERGRDISDGGAKYKVLAPLMNGIEPAIDTLYAIRYMVFSSEAVFTLPDLARCLICDWGYDMKEPFVSGASDQGRIAVQSERYKNLRTYALGLPKFGKGQPDVDLFARKLVRDLVDMAHDLIRNPPQTIAARLESLRNRYGTAQYPFEFVLTPGIATFEDYGGIGSFLGASADGRRSGHPIASDFSPSPTPPDLPVDPHGRDAIRSLKSWAAGEVGETLDNDIAHIDPIGVGLSNGAPVDINIRESFPRDQLVDLIGAFARGEIGSNMLSISCADPETLAEAQRFPERYDLVRVRMGGWSEFFVAMFPYHQEHHKRRPIFEARAQVARQMAVAWRPGVRR